METNTAKNTVTLELTEAEAQHVHDSLRWMKNTMTQDRPGVWPLHNVNAQTRTKIERAMEVR